MLLLRHEQFLGSVLAPITKTQSKLLTCLQFQYFVKYFLTELSFLAQIYYLCMY